MLLLCLPSWFLLSEMVFVNLVLKRGIVKNIYEIQLSNHLHYFNTNRKILIGIRYFTKYTLSFNNDGNLSSIWLYCKIRLVFYRRTRKEYFSFRNRVHLNILTYILINSALFRIQQMILNFQVVTYYNWQ